MKTNIVLLILAVFVISLIISLNIFFQQSYQSEMAEQFNRQQILIARSVSQSIAGDMEHLEAETRSLARLIGERGLGKPDLGEFVDTAYFRIREDMNLNVKILSDGGDLLYSSFGESLGRRDIELLRQGQSTALGKVIYVDLLAADRKIILLSPIDGGEGRRGVLLAEVMIENINRKFLAPLRAGIRGYTWMMDGSGTLLYHPTQPDMVGKNLYRADSSCFGCHTSFDVEKKILESGDVGFSSYIAPYGQDKLIAFAKAKIGNMSWIVCVSIPYSEVTLSIRNSIRLHSLLVISIFLATVLGASSLVLVNRQRIKAEERTKHLEKQRSLEKEIVEAKDYLENILESTESKIMVLDRGFAVKTVNSANERISGRTKDEVVGKGFFEVFPVASDQHGRLLRESLDRCLEGVSGRISNYPYRVGDATLYLNISMNPLVLHGTIEGIIISSSDVTEEVNLKEVLRDYAARLEDLVKERTDELLRERDKLNAIVEAVGAGLFLIDSAKNVIWVNKTLKDWTGREGIEGQGVDTLYGSDEIKRAIVTDKMVQEVIYQDFGKKKGYFQVTSTPLVPYDGRMQTLVLIQDITDMKRMEEQMMHSEKLSALARISAGVAHEIGNPLTSISSYVQILREMDHDEFTKESLDTIAKHINRIADIVRQMASFSRSKAADLRFHDVGELIQMTLDLVKYDKRLKKMAINVDVPAGLPKVKVNETQCIQVFMNIILNAADATANVGVLDIAARQIDGEIEIAFADTGQGIPQDHREKIFDPFFTTKEKGTGLGLAVSYNIIKAFQGDILVENRPEGGTIFRVRLPYHEIESIQDPHR